MYQANVLRPKRLLTLAHLPRTRTADSRALLSSGSRVAQGTHCSDARMHQQAGCAPSLKQMSKLYCNPHPAPHKLLDCPLQDAGLGGII